MRQIFLYEAGRILDQARFRALTLLILLLMTVAAFAFLSRYRAEAQEQEAVRGRYRQDLAAGTLGEAVALPHPALKPPWRLALFVEGGQQRSPDVYRQTLSPWSLSELSRTYEGNPRLPTPFALDWMFVLGVVLSLAAFVLGHDAVCGERRTGTLWLLLSYPVPRWKVLAGKWLAATACLVAVFCAGAAIGLLVVELAADELLTAGDFATVALLTALGVWAVAFYVLTALLVSTLSRDAAASLTVLALLWITAVFFLPAAGGLLAYDLHPLPAPMETEGRIAQIQERIAREYGGREGNWRPPGWARADGYAWEKVSAQAQNRRHQLQEEVQWQVLEHKLAQARLSRRIANFSPTSLIQDIAERITGSGLERDRRFLQQARAFRAHLALKVRELDRRDPASPHILFIERYMSQRRADPEQIPSFLFREKPLPERLAEARALALLLGLETALLALAALISFQQIRP
ncbi:MAG TPA: ABC transporter permease subunit [Thermoanaerobaculia bacterium]|nr:ABC transporter permease subunit [Thermoanaerobaculia bacterium]